LGEVNITFPTFAFNKCINKMNVIDLRSDTVTKPTAAMLDAMMYAKVGDDVFQEDPTILELESMAAKIFGKEDALFCTSGTQSNQIGIRLHTTPGGEVITHKESHVYKYEGGGIAMNASCSVKLNDGNRGRLTLQQVKESVNNPADVHLPLTQLVSVEDTANRGGGAIYDIQELKSISDFCKKNNFKFHLDGARVFNALVETGVPAAEYGNMFDSISICLSKGLGAPVGSLIIGTKEEMIRARRIRKVMGGGMRQAGILAAAGIFALENNIERLKTDHFHARQIGEAVKKCEWVEDVFPVSTNIVVICVKENSSVALIVEKLKEKNILTVPFGPQMLRMVTHLDISAEMVNRVCEEIIKLK
jgi:threonine aldolase